MRLELAKHETALEAPAAPADQLNRMEETGDFGILVAEKIDDLRRYDVRAMDRVAAIMMWGRSGSFLLASYLDNHEDVVMLPEGCAYALYDYFENHRSLSLRDKLIGYATFSPDYIRFFEGDFAISRTQYFAAVEAIAELYGDGLEEFLASRRAFFVFVHIAYTLAVGRRLAGSRPLIVYAQHHWDETLARHLAEDFPGAKFIHTIRDPISSCDALFHFHQDSIVEHHVYVPVSVLSFLIDKDRPFSGLEEQTLVVRFEDLHTDLERVMHGLADWLGLTYGPTLLESTFNGIPYVMKRDGMAWSGRRVEQIKRLSRHISPKDRALLYAFFYDNFVAWGYPCPRVFRWRVVRGIVFFSLILVPLKMEIIAARAIFHGRMLPAIRRGDLARVIKSSISLAFCRTRIVWRLTPAFVRRSIRRPALLRLSLDRPPEPEACAAEEYCRERHEQ